MNLLSITEAFGSLFTTKPRPVYPRVDEIAQCLVEWMVSNQQLNNLLALFLVSKDFHREITRDGQAARLSKMFNSTARPKTFNEFLCLHDVATKFYTPYSCVYRSEKWIEEEKVILEKGKLDDDDPLYLLTQGVMPRATIDFEHCVAAAYSLEPVFLDRVLSFSKPSARAGWVLSTLCMTISGLRHAHNRKPVTQVLLDELEAVYIKYGVDKTLAKTIIIGVALENESRLAYSPETASIYEDQVVFAMLTLYVKHFSSGVTFIHIIKDMKQNNSKVYSMIEKSMDKEVLNELLAWKLPCE